MRLLDNDHTTSETVIRCWNESSLLAEPVDRAPQTT
jgi:hypothetical protein